MRGLAQCSILNNSMICRFIYLSRKPSWRQLANMIGGPPVPKNLTVPAELYQQIYACTRYKIPTPGTGDGVQRIEQRRTDHILMHNTRVRINLVDASKRSHKYSPVCIYHPCSHFDCNRFL